MTMANGLLPNRHPTRWAPVNLAALLLISALGSAAAEAGVVVNFSSVDDFGVPASDLSARVTFTEVNNVSPGTGGTLTIEIQNLSTNFSLADLSFNAVNGGSMTVTAVTSDQTSGGPKLSDPSISGAGNPLQQPADGFGKFGYDLNWGVNSGDRLAPSKTATFTMTYTGSVTDADLETTVTKSYGANDGKGAPLLRYIRAVFGVYGVCRLWGDSCDHPSGPRTGDAGDGRVGPGFTHPCSTPSSTGGGRLGLTAVRPALHKLLCRWPEVWSFFSVDRSG